jgi:hypothetical protein
MQTIDIIAITIMVMWLGLIIYCCRKDSKSEDTGKTVVYFKDGEWNFYSEETTTESKDIG